MNQVMGIDLGTQSLKAIVYDTQSRSIVASGSASLDLLCREDGAREQMAQWWIVALQAAISEIEPRFRSAVSAIGISGQQHGFVPVSSRGEVLAPVKLWCDTSTGTECDEIMAGFGGPQRCIAELGNPVLPGYTASKIRWLRKHEREAYARLATVLLPHDYLNFYLTGERYSEYGDASGTGLLDIRQRRWHREMLACVDAERDLLDCMPPLIQAGDAGGALRPAIAELLGLPAGIPVACGGGDNMMAAIATGNVTEGRLTMSLGTSGTMFAYSDRPCIDDRGELAAFCSSTGGWLPLLCTMNCSVATEAARELFHMDLVELEKALARSAPGANGVTVLPFYNGERTPNLPNGRGCILGLTPGNTSPENITRASMEAAIFGLRRGLEAFERSNCPVSEIRLTGGAAKNRIWRQSIADCFALPVSLLAADEGAALGAALNAMLIGHPAHGDSRALAAAVDEHVCFDPAAAAEPDTQRFQLYAESWQRYRDYLEILEPAFK